MASGGKVISAAEAACCLWAVLSRWLKPPGGALCAAKRDRRYAENAGLSAALRFGRDDRCEGCSGRERQILPLRGRMANIRCREGGSDRRDAEGVGVLRLRIGVADASLRMTGLLELELAVRRFSRGGIWRGGLCRLPGRVASRRRWRGGLCRL